MQKSGETFKQRAKRTYGYHQRWEEGTSTIRHFLFSGPLREGLSLVLFAILVGVIGGLGALLFRWMISFFKDGFAWLIHGQFLNAASGGIPGWLVVFSPPLGLLIVGFISTYLAREVKGHGVPQILESLALRGGKIRPIVAVFGIIAPAVTIGSGGSVGQEGPIALIGASFGSVLGQTLRLSDKYISLLLACGAAAGIAATFKAPIAGAFFGLEVVLGSYAMGAIVPVFISAIIGTLTFTQLTGTEAILTTPGYALNNPMEIFLILLLGFIAGFVGLAYTKGLTISEDIFEHWKMPFWGKALIGGLLVGLIGLALPEVLGVGYETMEKAVSGKLPLMVMLTLLLAKYLATIITVGAGGSGGVFAPSLYLGLMLGGSFGLIAERILPGLVTDPVIYSIVGMGAIFAASAQAPLVASTIILEMTGDYKITVGVMAACAISYLIHGSLSRDSMYTVKLTKRGLIILRGTDIRPTQRIPVKVAMRPAKDVISLYKTTVEEAYQKLLESDSDILIVQEEGGRMAGILAASDLREIAAKDKSEILLKDVLQKDVISIAADANLEDAMRLFAFYDLNTIPVVKKDDPQIVEGVLNQSDVLKAYSTRTVHSMETTAKINLLRSTYRDEGGFRSMVLQPQSPVIGKHLSEIRLPNECVIVSVTRGNEVLVPHGNTQLLEGDTLLIFAAPSNKLEDICHKVNQPNFAGT